MREVRNPSWTVERRDGHVAVLAVCRPEAISRADRRKDHARNRPTRNALANGATADEIMEVLELTSVLGIHTCTLGVPALLDEVAAHAATTGG